MTTYIHDQNEFQPAAIFQGVQLVKGKLVTGFYSNEKNTRTVIPTTIKAPNGKIEGFYYDGGLDRVKKTVTQLLSLGAVIENGVLVIDGATFHEMGDGSNAHFREWSSAPEAWEASHLNKFRFNSVTRRYEYQH